ncbi:MAG TPA: hypothetical protein VFP34_08505 [Microlunatus sp.]|nr:hypothetical protein [Microlunatus sp.]
MPVGTQSVTVKGIAWGVWGGGVLSLLSNAVAASTVFVADSEPAVPAGLLGVLTWWAEWGDPILTGCYGACQLGLYGWMAGVMGREGETIEAVWNAVLGLGEAFEWVMQLTKPIVTWADPEESTKIFWLDVVLPRTEMTAYTVVTVMSSVAAIGQTTNLLAPSQES